MAARCQVLDHSGFPYTAVLDPSTSADTCFLPGQKRGLCLCSIPFLRMSCTPRFQWYLHVFMLRYNENTSFSYLKCCSWWVLVYLELCIHSHQYLLKKSHAHCHPNSRPAQPQELSYSNPLHLLFPVFTCLCSKAGNSYFHSVLQGHL